MSNEMIGLRERLAYGLGDMACAMVAFSYLSLLMYFYTDVAYLPVAAVGTMMFVVRAWDAVWDICVGGIVDRTNTRWGRARPYVLWGGVLLAISWVAAFHTPDDASVRLVYAYATYMLLMTTFSAVNIPIFTLPALMTSDPDQRLRLQISRAFCGSAGNMLVGVAFMPLVAWFGVGNRGGYQLAIVVMAVVALMLWLTCFQGTRERLAPNTPSRSKGAGMADLRALVRSPAWWPMILVSVGLLTGLLTLLGSAVYYYQYVVRDVSAVSTFFLMYSLGGLTGVVASDRFTRLFCKRGMASWALLCSALTGLGFLVAPTEPKSIGFGLAFFNCVTTFMALPVLWSTVNDTADYVELESGRSVAGLAAGTASFSAKLSMGLASLLIGGVLSFVDYKAGMVATPSVRQGILLLMGPIPALAFAASALVLWRSPFGRIALASLATTLQDLRSRGQLTAPTSTSTGSN